MHIDEQAGTLDHKLEQNLSIFFESWAGGPRLLVDTPLIRLAAHWALHLPHDHLLTRKALAMRGATWLDRFGRWALRGRLNEVLWLAHLQRIEHARCLVAGLERVAQWKPPTQMISGWGFNATWGWLWSPIKVCKTEGFFSQDKPLGEMDPECPESRPLWDGDGVEDVAVDKSIQSFVLQWTNEPSPSLCYSFAKLLAHWALEVPGTYPDFSSPEERDSNWLSEFAKFALKGRVMDVVAYLESQNGWAPSCALAGMARVYNWSRPKEIAECRIFEIQWGWLQDELGKPGR